MEATTSSRDATIESGITNSNNFSQFKFEPDWGSIDKGREYEEKVTGFLSVKAAQSTNNFWMASNMAGMTPLDDVIICPKNSGKNVVYFCQIKHSQKTTELQGGELADVKSKLCMHKFYEKFQLNLEGSEANIKDKITACVPSYYKPVNDFKIVIFTNRTIDQNDRTFKRKFNEIDQLFNTNGGEVYGLNSETFSREDLLVYINTKCKKAKVKRISNQFDQLVTSNSETFHNIFKEFEHFLNSVYVYANQGHASNVQQNIQICMENLSGKSKTEESLSIYMKFIQNWMQITQAKNGLDNKLVGKLLELSCMLSHALEIDITQITNKKIPGDYLWEDIQNKSLFINKSYLPFATMMISKNLHHFDKKEEELEIGKILFQNYDYQTITLKQKYILSCFFGQSPFIIDTDQFPNLPKFQFMKNVPIGNVDNSKNLDQLDDNTSSKLLDEPITLSSGRKIVFQDVLNDSSASIPTLSVSDALSILYGNNNTRDTEPLQFPANLGNLNLQQLYPIWDVSFCREPLRVQVQKSVDFLHDEIGANRAPIYRTRSKLRGMALIINVYHVRDHIPRRGSERDVQNLRDLFEQIGMKVDTEIDRTKQEIMRELENFVKNPELKRCDISVLVIMSHGGLSDNNHQFFLCTDGERIFTRDVESFFNNSNSVYMQAKPKIVVYQIGRCKSNDYGIIPGDYTESDDVISDSIITDLLVIHSTLKEYKSKRDIFTGSWFIQLLCKVFMHYAHSTHVEDMLKWLQSSMALQRSDDGTVQILEYMNRGFKLCYLNPGIYMENGNSCHYE